MNFLDLDIQKKCGEFNLRVKFSQKSRRAGLLGSSGCGKSMTLQCISGLMKPDSGRIVCQGKVLFDSDRGINLSAQERKTAYLFSDYLPFMGMTVLNNVAFVIKGNRSERKAKAKEYLKQFYIEDLANLYPDFLSSGQKQRLAFARVLASKPDFLLLDEPLSALDSKKKYLIQRNLDIFLENSDIPMIYVTHSADELMHFCEDLFVMDNGEIVESLSVEDAISQPTCRATGELFSMRNFSSFHIERGLGAVSETDTCLVFDNWGGFRCRLTDILNKNYSEQDILLKKWVSCPPNSWGLQSKELGGVKGTLVHSSPDFSGMRIILEPSIVRSSDVMNMDNEAYLANDAYIENDNYLEICLSRDEWQRLNNEPARYAFYPKELKFFDR